MSASDPYVNLDLSTRSEMTIAYALTTTGTNRTESAIIRHLCADALDELRHPDGAEEVRRSISEHHSVRV